nr:hypothetical protein [Tanacetum cinerariifolium]
MAISTILISLDSSEESVGTPSGRVLWFGRILTTVAIITPTIDLPIIHGNTSLIPTKTPTISPITSTIPPTAPITHKNLHLSTPTHLTMTYLIHHHHSLMRYHSVRLNHLLVRFYMHHSVTHYDRKEEGPSRKRSRSPTTSVLVSSPVPGALSSIRVDLLPPRKRIRSSDSAMDLEDCSGKSSESSVPRETSLRNDVVVRSSDEPYSEPDIDLEIQAEIDECIAYADALRAKGIDDRVVVETVAREEVETSARGTVEVRVDRVTHHVVSDDIPEPAQEEGSLEVTYETLGDLVQRFHDRTVEIPVHRFQVIKSIQRDHGHKILATGQ